MHKIKLILAVKAGILSISSLPSRTHKTPVANSMKQVAVIIINFNSSAYTVDCINSIIKETAPGLSYEIIVVDNNSAATDYETLLQQTEGYPNLSIHRSIVNLGFSGGNMFGLQFANAAYCFFLNNDCVLLNDNLSILYTFMQEHPDAGLCCGQMYNSDMSFHHSFGYFPAISLKLLGSSAARLFSAGAYPKRKVKYSEPVQVPLVTGAAMFVDFRKLAEIGGFDTNYFLYCEEEDVAKRLQQKGYTCYMQPEAKFIHHMGKSTSRNYAILRENYISLLYYHRKHHTYLAYTLFKFIYFFKNIKRFYKGLIYIKLAFFILKGAPLTYSLKHSQKIYLSVL